MNVIHALWQFIGMMLVVGPKETGLKFTDLLFAMILATIIVMI